MYTNNGRQNYDARLDADYYYDIAMKNMLEKTSHPPIISEPLDGKD